MSNTSESGNRTEGKVTANPVCEKSALFVFFSFDLVNSTRFKSLNKNGWPFVARRFYEAVIDSMIKRIEGFRIWKYVGDEVLLFKHIAREDQLRPCLEAASEVIVNVTDTIHREFPDTRKLLGIKGTIWSARVTQFSPPDTSCASNAGSQRIKNLIFRSTGGGQDQIDFLGPDIDVGFRIAKHTLRRRLVVSAELAYLLYLGRASYENIEKQLRVVSYEVLKGVWDDRRYPIVWYERDWDKVPATFLYDEHFENSIVHNVRFAKEKLGVLQDLTRVFEDHGRLDDLQELRRDLEKGLLADESSILGEPKELASRIEVHCVAVCFRDDGRVLVAKRPSSKRRYPGLWEFGCGQLAEGETFAECMTRNYKSDFGVDLYFFGEPRPIQSYVIPGTGKERSIPGVVFIAGVGNWQDVKVTKHDNIDWIDPRNLPADIDSTFVPASKERLLRASAAYEKARSETVGGNKS